jgi:hypothetical protein
VTDSSTAHEESPRPYGAVPYTHLAGRAVIAGLTTLLIVLICTGFAGSGPGQELASLTHKSFAWIDSWSGTALESTHRHRHHRHHRHHRRHAHRHHTHHSRNK